MAEYGADLRSGALAQVYLAPYETARRSCAGMDAVGRLPGAVCDTPGRYVTQRRQTAEYLKHVVASADASSQVALARRGPTGVRWPPIAGSRFTSKRSATSRSWWRGRTRAHCSYSTTARLRRPFRFHRSAPPRPSVGCARSRSRGRATPPRHRSRDGPLLASWWTRPRFSMRLMRSTS
jgi:hypothetical protein